MLGRAKAWELIDLALSKSRAEQTEVTLAVYDSYLTRFANSEIHQNVAEHNAYVAVRAAIGKKIGAASTSMLDSKAVEETVKQACEIAMVQIENPDFLSFPVGPFTYQNAQSYVPATHELSAADRARSVGAIIEIVRNSGLRAFGSYTNGASEIGVGNSLGVKAYATDADVYCNVVAVGETSSGYATGTTRQVVSLNPIAIAQRAVDKALQSQNPTDLEPGAYEVILEPLATAELAEYLAWMGFSAKAYQEQRSFLCGRLGTKIVDEPISLWDDAYDVRGFAFPFDAEGVPKQKVPLIIQGTSQSLVFDSLTAGKASRQSTGHASPGGYGPSAQNLVFAPGEATREAMIKDCRRGLLVTRFHYTNSIDPMKTIITGMTRDGTFLIENGQISRPVKNLRFTQNILTALSRVWAVSKELELTGGGAGYGPRFATGTLAPYLYLAEFNFSGKTEF